MKKKLVFITTFLILGGIAGIALATPVVDQTNLYTAGTASGPSVSSNFYQAQTVTNGITGKLAVLELNVSRRTYTFWPLIVQIRGSVNNEPSDKVFVQKVIDASNVNTPPNSILSIDFTQDNIFFNNGDVFSIVLHSKNNVDNEFNWWMPSGKDYIGGNAYTSVDIGVSWKPIISSQFYDFGFQTFIEPSPVPTTLNITGFEPPCDSPDVTISVKKNKCIPLKTELFDADGYPITDTDIEFPPVLVLESFSGANEASEPVIIDGVPPNEGTDGNQFEFIGGRWCFNLKVKDYYTAPGTYTFKMTTGNQTEYIIEPTGTVQIVVEK